MLLQTPAERFEAFKADRVQFVHAFDYRSPPDVPRRMPIVWEVANYKGVLHGDTLYTIVGRLRLSAVEGVVHEPFQELNLCLLGYDWRAGWAPGTHPSAPPDDDPNGV
jgi:hypothetical protein